MSRSRYGSGPPCSCWVYYITFPFSSPVIFGSATLCCLFDLHPLHFAPYHLSLAFPACSPRTFRHVAFTDSPLHILLFLFCREASLASPCSFLRGLPPSSSFSTYAAPLTLPRQPEGPLLSFALTGAGLPLATIVFPNLPSLVSTLFHQVLVFSHLTLLLALLFFNAQFPSPDTILIPPPHALLLVFARDSLSILLSFHLSLSCPSLCGSPTLLSHAAARSCVFFLYYFASHLDLGLLYVPSLLPHGRNVKLLFSICGVADVSITRRLSLCS